jgi:hypothetical protein
MKKQELVATLACGCRVGFRAGVEGSPVTGLAVYDHREALRPSTRLHPTIQPDYEDN